MRFYGRDDAGVGTAGLPDAYAIPDRRSIEAGSLYSLSSRVGTIENPEKKNPCLEMGGGGEADARPAFGRSARLGILLVVVNHRAPPSSPMVGRVSGSSSARTRV